MAKSNDPRTATPPPWLKVLIIAAVLTAALALVVAWSRGMFDPDLDALTDSEAGAYLIDSYGCRSCHQVGVAFRAPTLEDAFGRTAQLADGGSALVDEAYIREAILEPRAKVVKGYQPVMPSYQGQLTDRDIARIVAYMREHRG